MSVETQVISKEFKMYPVTEEELLAFKKVILMNNESAEEFYNYMKERIEGEFNINISENMSVVLHNSYLMDILLCQSDTMSKSKCTVPLLQVNLAERTYTIYNYEYVEKDVNSVRRTAEKYRDIYEKAIKKADKTLLLTKKIKDKNQELKKEVIHNQKLNESFIKALNTIEELTLTMADIFIDFTISHSMGRFSKLVKVMEENNKGEKNNG